MRTALLTALTLSLVFSGWLGTAFAQSIERPTTTVVPIVRVELAGPRSVPAGSVAEYSAQITVEGFDLHNAVLTVSLPDGLTFRSSDDSGEFDAGTVAWTFPDLRIGTHSAELRARVNSPIANGTSLIVQAALDSEETITVNAKRTTTVESAPRLAVTKSFGVSQVTPGSEVTAFVKVSNEGTDAAKAITLEETLPDGFRSVADNGTVIRLALGDLEAGQSATAEYGVRIQPNVAPASYATVTTIQAENHEALAAEATLVVQAAPIPEAPTEPAPSRGQVLGASTELPETGISFGDWLLIALAALLLTAGITTFAFYPFPPRSRG